jgi:PAS domain S-box-containing protein
MLGWLGLRTRLVLLVLLALLPLFGLLAYYAEQGRRTALEHAQVDLQAQVALLATHQHRTVDKVHELLNGLASAPHIKSHESGLCGQQLKNIHQEHPEFTHVGVAAPDGRLVCSSLGLPAGSIQEDDRPFFLQIMAGQRFAIGTYGIGRSSGLPGLIFAIPVHTDSGAMGGVAFASLGLKALAEPLSAVSMMPGARLTVLDRDGVVLAVSPQAPSWLGRQHPDAAVRQGVQTRHLGVLHAPDAQGSQRVYAFAPVPVEGHDGLFVAVSVPQEIIGAESRDNLLSELAALLAMAVASAACAWWMGNRLIVNPAKAILKEANEVAEGNLAARVRLGPLYRGELGDIGQTFNRMAGSLQARQEELDAALSRVDKERSLLDLILNSMSEGVIAADTEGRFLVFNATARKLFNAATPGPGMRVEEWRRNHELLMLDGKTHLPEAERPLTRAARGVSTDNWDLVFRRPGAEDRVLRMSTRPLRGDDGTLVGGVAVFNDITKAKAAEQFAKAQEQVLALIAGSAPLQRSLEAVVQLIETSSPDSLCSILLLDGQHLRLGAAPSLPDSYNQAIEGLPVGEGVGACGTAAFRNEMVVVEDTQLDPLMKDYRELLATHNLRACWSHPVVSTTGEPLATFAIYHRYPCAPQAHDLELIATAARLAGIALVRARAEAALVSSEARFRELAENINDVFYNVDPRSGQLLYISPGYEKVWARSRESLYANPLSYADAALPEDQPLLKLARKRNRTGESSDIEYRILSTDGKLRWIHDHSYPVLDASGVLERVVGTARDITDRKLADLALANTNRALQMLSQSSIAINRIEDEEALLAEVCRVAVDVGNYRMAWVGYAQNDEARTIQPMVHAGNEGGYLTVIRLTWRDDQVTGQGPAGQAIRTGLPRQSGDIGQAENHFYWHADAMKRGYRSAVCLPLREGARSFGVLCLYSAEAQHFTPEEIKLLQELADNLAFGIVSLRERLERQRSQEAARQAAVKLREQASLLDRAQDAIMVRNLDRTIRFWNKSAERLYGWTAEEVLGKSMEEFMYEDPQVLVGAMARTLANEGDWTGELEQRARDGSTVAIEARWTVVRDEEGKVNGVLGINTDIRERRRAREEILRLNASLEERVQQRTAQLEFANKQLEAFSYSVSHDLRSPLSAIDGFSDLLQRAMNKSDSTPLSERSRHYLARIRAGVGQMGELIDAMLTLAQVSRSSLRWEPVDLSALVQGILDGYREREPERPVTLHVEAGLTGQGDPRLLMQLLDNLLGNAWKFSANQERTEITFGHEVGEDGETVYFVQDKGAGFDMAYAEKLFGAFQRLHSLSEFAGTGIGLATVHRIVARHGGKVWAQSSLGQGATFYFTLGERTL